MPGFIKTQYDERIWARAVNTFAQEYGHNPQDDDYAIVTKIYRNMKGIKEDESGLSPMDNLTATKLAQKFHSQLNESYSEMDLQSAIRDFVKKIIDNPIKSALIAYAVYLIIKSWK